MQPKDFHSAFATLESTYGFIGIAPSPVLKQKNSSTKSSIASPVVASRALKATKNFESAFTDLQSTYGFSGAIPSPVPKKRGGGSFFSKFRSSSSARSPSTFTPKTKVRAVPRPTQQMISL
ncbi:hypothetical protein B0H19DRAFT_1113443 [Mycena capillaripes]|nr:hypothetical protein B0H19DRAFT_1113443 [Mycena capillaripes]